MTADDQAPQAPAHTPGRDETEAERADRRFTDILQEVRITLTGTQLISGFLLAVAFQSGFADLDASQRLHYLILVALAGLATMLGLVPVMVHRLHSGRFVKDRIVSMANAFLVATLVVVSLLMIGVTSLIFEVVVSAGAGLWAAIISIALVAGLWAIAAFSRSLS